MRKRLDLKMVVRMHAVTASALPTLDITQQYVTTKSNFE